MNYGAGAVIFQGLPNPTSISPGPPFALNSADNGLSVDPTTFRIVLGNDVGDSTAALLSNREIPMAGNSFTMLDSLNRQFQVDPAGNFFGLGDIDGGNGSTFIGIDDAGQEIDLIAVQELHHADNLGNRFFISSPVTGQYQFGDINAAGNGNRLRIDDSIDQYSLGINGVASYLFIAPPLYELGDIAQINNKTFFQIDDNAKAVNVFTDQTFTVLNSLGSSTLEVNAVMSGFKIGDSVDGSYMQCDGAGNLFYGTPTDTFFSTSPTLGLYKLGDITPFANGTHLEIDDTTQSFNFHNTTLGVAQFSFEGGEMRINKPGTNSFIQLINSSFSDGLRFSSATNTIQTLTGSGAVTIAPAIKTSDPGSGQGTWKIGVPVVAASVVDTTRYVETSINGVIVKLATMV